jgi:hypothetical protein
MRGLAGLCDANASTIWIDSKVEGRGRELTYVHEVLHALWPEGTVSAEVEERLILKLEGPMLSAIKRGAFVLAPEEVP